MISYGEEHRDTGAWADEDGTVRNGQPVRPEPPVTQESSAPGVAELYPALDWHAAFAAQPVEVQWLVEPIFERGKSYALFAPAKAGKSLIMQDVTAGLAAGAPVLGNLPGPAVRVLYVDLENAVIDVVERMSAYGYGPDDLANLRYLSFPSLPPLDTSRGGQHLVELAHHHAAELVVIDTVSRVIKGGENDADTLHAAYRHALSPLKAAGIAVVRLDHAGKDVERGQRGTSAKATDVDVVWRLDVDGPTGVTLTRTASRNTHHPEQVHLVKRFEPFRHELADGPALAVGTADAVAALDALGVPVNAGRDVCRAALVTAHVKVANLTLADAVRHRKTRPGEVPG